MKRTGTTSARACRPNIFSRGGLPRCLRHWLHSAHIHDSPSAEKKRNAARCSCLSDAKTNRKENDNSRVVGCSTSWITFAFWGEGGVDADGAYGTPNFGGKSRQR